MIGLQPQCRPRSEPIISQLSELFRVQEHVPRREQRSGYRVRRDSPRHRRKVH
jgi:hypothetical protein